MEEAVYWIWFAFLFGFGTRRADQLIGLLGTPKAIAGKTAAQLEAMHCLTKEEIGRVAANDFTAAEEAFQNATALGCHVLTPDHPEYPQRLRNIYAMPLALYVQGSLEGLDGKLALGMVGTRHVTEYGKKVASTLSYQLAKAGAVVVSGMAMGIDQICHKGALKAGGKTIAVLGCGIDCDYPKNSDELKKLTAKYGAVVTEYPPGWQPIARNFPVRNRIISGLSNGVVVIEADEHSGSLITAGHALSQGREVFAVPGRIDALYSSGTNKLIKQGAKPVTEAMDVVEEFLYRWPDITPIERIKRTAATPAPQKAEEVAITAEQPAQPPKKPAAKRKPAPDYLSPNQLALYKALTEEPQSAEQLSEIVKLPIHQILAALTELEIYGLIKMHAGRRFGI